MVPARSACRGILRLGYSRCSRRLGCRLGTDWHSANPSSNTMFDNNIFFKHQYRVYRRDWRVLLNHHFAFVKEPERFCSRILPGHSMTRIIQSPWHDNILAFQAIHICINVIFFNNSILWLGSSNPNAHDIGKNCLCCTCWVLPRSTGKKAHRVSSGLSKFFKLFV